MVLETLRSTRFLKLAGLALALSPLAHAQTVLNANPGPANNGGSPNWAIFFDVSATTSVTITHMTTANTGAAGAAFSVEVLTYVGSCLGGPVSAGPGSSPTGWTSLGTAPATQGPVSSGISDTIDIPDIVVPAGQTVGVAVRFTTVGPRYFGTGTPPLGNYTDGTLSLTTGESRSAPFTPTGSYFTSRELVGSLTYTVGGGGGPIVYCTSGVSTSGCAASIGSTGTPTTGAVSGFTIDVGNVEGQKQGLVFYGVSGQAAVPWITGSTSFLCVKAPTQRLPVQNSGGTLGGCDGALSQDFLAFIAANPSALGAPFTVGAVVNAQAWYRDPPAPKTTNLSDGLEFVMQ